DRPLPVCARIRQQSRTFFLPPPAQRTPRPAPPVAAPPPFSRPARLRQATRRRAALVPPLRKTPGLHRRIPAPLPHRRAGAGRMFPGGGIDNFGGASAASPNFFVPGGAEVRPPEEQL